MLLRNFSIRVFFIVFDIVVYFIRYKAKLSLLCGFLLGWNTFSLTFNLGVLSGEVVFIVSLHLTFVFFIEGNLSYCLISGYYLLYIRYPLVDDEWLL